MDFRGIVCVVMLYMDTYDCIQNAGTAFGDHKIYYFNFLLFFYFIFYGLCDCEVLFFYFLFGL